MAAYDQLHVFFFPMMAQGHMIPTLDLAKLFASRGVRATIITTPRNQHVFSDSIVKATQLGGRIQIVVLDFPAVQAGLPEGCERLDLAPDDLVPNFHAACAMLQEPLEQLLQQHRPDCLVADMFFPWATDAAAKFHVPRLVFHGVSYIALCAWYNLRVHDPFKNVSSDCEPVPIPNLPHDIRLTRLQLSPVDRGLLDSYSGELMKQVRESDVASYGVIFNSFYELEREYADYYTNILGIKAWPVGPLSLRINAESRAERGDKPSMDEHQCLKWLDSKAPNSIVYICFGSGMASFAPNQLRELAVGIESSGLGFVWVIRKGRDEEAENNNEKWMPEGFEERTKERGLVIRGWAPQVVILDHQAVGAFVTHCGWNSTLEGVCAGVPFVTWPMCAEQFYNEKLVTEVLKTGVGVGSKKWMRSGNDGVESAAIAEAMKRVMMVESEELRSRAKAYKEMAKKAIEEGGSSYCGLTALLDELTTLHHSSRKH
ncbi:PREDICTED: scopoletin glucosyltransferase-like [Ipomoea nil]|uniref:scopoletin glucosyltransferase-like n=1 Tax=Ipomoea nil TaxID=35883 RepID=UPI0009015197|nr:PREDICTED: scopoletin glucosyltransferase-like [Ipomoea nil]